MWKTVKSYIGRALNNRSRLQGPKSLIKQEVAKVTFTYQKCISA